VVQASERTVSEHPGRSVRRLTERWCRSADLRGRAQRRGPPALGIDAEDSTRAAPRRFVLVGDEEQQVGGRGEAVLDVVLGCRARAVGGIRERAPTEQVMPLLEQSEERPDERLAGRGYEVPGGFGVPRGLGTVPKRRRAVETRPADVERTTEQEHIEVINRAEVNDSGPGEHGVRCAVHVARCDQDIQAGPPDQVDVLSRKRPRPPVRRIVGGWRSHDKHADGLIGGVMAARGQSWAPSVASRSHGR